MSTKIAQRKDINPDEGETQYGDVSFADETNEKYPIDTPRHVRAAWSYINMPKNASKYSSSDLASLKTKIKSAAKKLGVDILEKSFSFKHISSTMKAFQEDDKCYIKGLASGLDLDLDEERMAKSAIDGMTDDVNNGIVKSDGSISPVILNDDHMRRGICEDIGHLVSAQKAEGHDWWITAQLDMDNPSAQYLYAKVEKGDKKFGFSIQGKVLKKHKEYDNELGKSTTFFDDILLEKVSVTPRPIYERSFIQSIAKSYIESENEMLKKSASEKEETIETTAETENESETSDKVETNADNSQNETAENRSSELGKGKTDSDNNSQDEVNKAASSVTSGHVAMLRDKVAHLHSHLNDILDGTTDLDSEKDHLKTHTADIHGIAKAVASGKTDGLKESKRTYSTGIYRSQADKETEDDVNKSKIEADIDKSKEDKLEKSESEYISKSEHENVVKSLTQSIEELQKGLHAIGDIPKMPKFRIRPVIKNGVSDTQKSKSEQVQDLYKSFQEDARNPAMDGVRFSQKWDKYVPIFKAHDLPISLEK